MGMCGPQMQLPMVNDRSSRDMVFNNIIVIKGLQPSSNSNDSRLQIRKFYAFAESPKETLWISGQPIPPPKYELLQTNASESDGVPARV